MSDHQPKNKQGPNVVLRVPSEILSKWDQYCSENKITRSELIRLSVNQKIEESEKKNLEKYDEILLYYFKSLRRDLDQKFETIDKQISLINKKII